MAEFIDQLGRRIYLNRIPQRIISLVPSQTELLYDLELDEQVIGITKFCVHPNHWFRTKTRVGGTKKVNFQQIIELKPHLIIANKEENVQHQIEQLEKHFPVWVSDVHTLSEALHMMKEVGKLTGTQFQADVLANKIQQQFASLKATILSYKKISTAYLIWRNPYMTAGGDTFINDMMFHGGFENVFSSEKRYPTLKIDVLNNINCELLLLSTEPFPFKQEHVDELKQQLPGVEIIIADGELFSWFGSRLQYAPQYFLELRKQLPG